MQTIQTIDNLLKESCTKNGTKVAMLSKKAGVWQGLAYEKLWEQSAGIAVWLMHEGFLPGDHAVLLAPSSPEWVAAYLGILRAGGVVVPVDKELKKAELRHILLDCDARAIFSEGVWLEQVQEIAGSLPKLSLVLTLSPELTGLDVFCHHTLAAGNMRRPEDTAVIFYTSGTTGRSKGAMLSHANIVSNIRAAAAHFSLDSSIHTLSFLPINHVFEQVCGVLLPLSLGGTVTFCESLKKLGDNLAEVRPTFFLGVPAVYRMLLDRIMKGIAARRLSKLLFAIPLTRSLVIAKVRKAFGSGTIFISGGAALDPAIAVGLARVGLSIYQGYGITETAPIISAEQPGGKRPGSVGLLLHGVEVRIDTPNAEGVGEILVRGPNVMQGYYNNPSATAEVLSDGWYRTGDLGKLTGDGFLMICGRVKNLIVTPNGKNVYPEEVENELVKSPFIAEAMVYGHRTGPVQEEIHAIIYPDQEALDERCRIEPCRMSERDLEELLRSEVQKSCSSLADYKRVRRITIREDEFPKTTTRKIKRFEVEASIVIGGEKKTR